MRVKENREGVEAWSAVRRSPCRGPAAVLSTLSGESQPPVIWVQRHLYYMVYKNSPPLSLTHTFRKSLKSKNRKDNYKDLNSTGSLVLTRFGPAQSGKKPASNK